MISKIVLTKINVEFFKSGSGNEPVREWLLSLTKVERITIGQDIRVVQLRWPIGMPLCKHIRNGLWEIRSSLPRGKIARIFFSVHEGVLVLLHGLIKKSQTTPKHDLDLAESRLKQLLGLLN